MAGLVSRFLSAVTGGLTAILAEFTALRETAYQPRIVEGALKIQVAFLALLIVVAPFGGFGLSPAIGAGLLLQAAATWGVLEAVWRRRFAVARWVYLGLAALTFVEAMRNTGIAGGIFGLEAVLSLVALWYIFALHRAQRRRAEAEAAAEAEDREGQADG